MGILTKEVEVILNSANMQYFRDKGYELPTHLNKNGKPITVGSKIIVPISDLNEGSNCHIKVLCDDCNTNIIDTTYANYNSKIRKQGRFLCKECGYKQAKLTSLAKYGVENYTQTEECQQKRRITCLEKYGVDCSLKNDSVKEKIKNTCLEKYGVEHPWQNDDIKAKVNKTIFERYGVDNISQLESIKEKKKETILQNYGYEFFFSSSEFKKKLTELYGVDNPMKNEDIRRNATLTLYNNSSQKASSQQLYINSLYKGELNYPCEFYSLDIALLDDNIDCEIDFGGHDLSVKIGAISQEEFNQKEIVRNNIVKRNNWKIMRIISRKDYLPSDSVLLDILSYTRNFFKENPERSWIEFDIDNSIIKNALGTYNYNFGELYRLPRTQSA